jgi:hypothetical protein
MLIAMVRHPIDRIRSHYRHEVQRGLETRPLIEAVQSSNNPYVAHSHYFRCLEPYIERFPRDRICIVRFEDLVQDGSPGWDEILRFLNLSPRGCPGTAYNVSDEHLQWSPLMGALDGLGLFRVRAIQSVPRPIRRMGRRLLLRDGADYRRALDESRLALIPAEVSESMWVDVSLLEDWLGLETPLWKRSSPSVTVDEPD